MLPQVLRAGPDGTEVQGGLLEATEAEQRLPERRTGPLVGDAHQLLHDALPDLVRLAAQGCRLVGAAQGPVLQVGEPVSDEGRVDPAVPALTVTDLLEASAVVLQCTL